LPPFFFLQALPGASTRGARDQSSITQSLIRRSSIHFFGSCVDACDGARNDARCAREKYFSFA